MIVALCHLSALLQLQVDMVKTLIGAYFDIVRRTIQDIVPKTVSWR